MPGTHYEVVGKSYLWGLVRGCYCPNGSHERWGEYTTRGVCNSTSEYMCHDISSHSARFYDVVNNQMLCARRESRLNLTSLPKPTVNSGEEGWTCPVDYKFCGNSEADNARTLTCVPEEYMCPINKVEFVD